MANAVAVSEKNFEAEVIQSTVPVLVDFWAAWCGPCRSVAPALEEIATEHNGRLKVVKVDVDENPEVSMRYDVRSIPTLILFKNGQVEGQKVGALRKTDLAAFLDTKL
jgi:thioredoxin 1